MDICFLIHGVLSGGQSCWKKQDVKYLESYYTSSKENVVLWTEVFDGDRGVGTYYTYLRYNNVLPISNRAGSYFGMTVWLEGYMYTDISMMYDILDRLFEREVVGTILVPTSAGGYQYTCDYFVQKQNELEGIEKKFVEIFLANINAQKDFYPATQVVLANQVYYANPQDMYSEQTIELLQQGYSIRLSKENLPFAFLSAKENTQKELELQKELYQKELARITASKDAQIEEQQAQIVELEALRVQLQTENQILVQDKQKLETDYKKLQAKKQRSSKTTETHECTQEPMRRMARRFPEDGCSSGEIHKNSHSRNMGRTSIINTIEKVAVVLILLIILGGVGYSSYMAYLEAQAQKEIPVKPVDKDFTNDDLKNSILFLTRDVCTKDNYRINIKDFAGGTFEQGKSYIAELQKIATKEIISMPYGASWEVEYVVNKDTTTINKAEFFLPDSIPSRTNVTIYLLINNKKTSIYRTEKVK